MIEQPELRGCLENVTGRHSVQAVLQDRYLGDWPCTHPTTSTVPIVPSTTTT